MVAADQTRLANLESSFPLIKGQQREKAGFQARGEMWRPRWRGLPAKASGLKSPEEALIEKGCKDSTTNCIPRSQNYSTNLQMGSMKSQHGRQLLHWGHCSQITIGSVKRLSPSLSSPIPLPLSWRAQQLTLLKPTFSSIFLAAGNRQSKVDLN